MSRVSHNTTTTRRPPAVRSPQRSTPSTSTNTRSMTRGGRAPTRGRAMHTQPPRQSRTDNDEQQPTQQERTTHVGDGFHMFTPSTTKREQIRKQAENEQRQYEEHIERTRLHGIREVHRLGGNELSIEEVRRRQAEKYRRDKFERLEKNHQDQSQKKQDEEKELEVKKQTARQQAVENEKRDRDSHLHSQGATGWTDETREDDRRQTMDRFLNRLTHQYDDMDISSDENKNHNNSSKSEKLSLLREMLPHIDDRTLEYNLEIYNGNIDAVVQELMN